MQLRPERLQALDRLRMSRDQARAAEPTDGQKAARARLRTSRELDQKNLVDIAKWSVWKPSMQGPVSAATTLPPKPFVAAPLHLLVLLVLLVLLCSSCSSACACASASLRLSDSGPSLQVLVIEHDLTVGKYWGAACGVVSAMLKAKLPIRSYLINPKAAGPSGKGSVQEGFRCVP